MTTMTIQQTSPRTFHTRPAADRTHRSGTVLRLTRRGRAVLLFVLVVLTLAAFSLGRASTSTAASQAPAARQVIVVQPGETLWAIAKRAAPDADPRVTVGRLRELNDLQGALQAGQRLVLTR
jgi:LysM repeat protein